MEKYRILQPGNDYFPVHENSHSMHKNIMHDQKNPLKTTETAKSGGTGS